MDYTELIGRPVFYYDYLGIQQKGYIVYVEPSNDPERPYLYMANIDPKENTHFIIFANGSVINYAELRPSSEVILVEDGEEETFDLEDIM